MLTFRIISGSCQNVPIIASSSQALALTSPPYAFAKDYRRSDDRNIGNYHHDEYFNMIEPVYREVYRVLMSGRKFILNITDLPEQAKSDGRFSYYKYGMRTVELCEKIGFELEETVLWIKGRNRSGGAAGSLPFPPSPMLLSNFEFMYVLRKPGETVTSHVSEDEREASKMSKDFMKDILYTSWPMHPETSIRYHKAPFPIELPSRFIKLYTFVGESVYEPFLGSGTTMLAAKQLHRSCTGVELGYDTDDGMTWLEHIKRRVGWLDGNLASKEVSYEVVQPDGTLVTDLVEGLGKDNLVDMSRRGSLEEFTEGAIAHKIAPKITHSEGKSDIAEDHEEQKGDDWEPKGWKKQRELF